jgi:hypothetical protein
MAMSSGFVRELNSQCWELSQRSRKCKRQSLLYTPLLYSILLYLVAVFSSVSFYSSHPSAVCWTLVWALILWPVNLLTLVSIQFTISLQVDLKSVSMVGSLNTCVDTIISVWLFRCWRWAHSWSCFLQYGDCENVSFWCSCVHCANICSIQEWMQSTRKESGSTLVKRRKMMPMETTDPPAILLLGILVRYSFTPWLGFSGFNLIFKGLEGFFAAGEAPVHMLYQVICVNLQFE